MKIKLFALVLFFFISFSIKSQETLPAEQKLNKALDFIKDYKIDSAEIILKKLVTTETQEKFPKIYTRASLNLGRIYGDKGNNVIALQYYQNALKTAENNKDKETIPHIYKNIGVLYVSWKKFDQAFNYYDKAEKLAEEINNKELIADCRNNKGIIYEQKEEYPKALSFYKSALEIYTEKKNQGKVAMALSNIAIVYKYQKKYPEAIDYNFKAIEIAEKQNDKWSVAATYNNIGNLYGEMGDYKKAIFYCEKALVIAKEIDAGEIIESIYDSMANAAEKADDYKNAFRYHQLFSESMSKFINKENTKQLSELNIKYETEKNQNTINQQKFQIKQKNNWLIFSAIAFLLSMLTGFFIYRNYKYKQDKKLQKEILRQQEIETKALFDGEQNERIRIARDLHDSVGQMLSVVKMNLSMQEKTPESANIQNLVDQTIGEVRSISHNLIPEELNFGIFSALESLGDKINASSNTKMEIEIPEEIRAIQFQKQNELSIYRIVQEVINNMVKHAEASTIKLSINKLENSIIINIRDNGKGLNDDAIKNSKGIGWKNINARVHMMDGKIKIQSEKLAGTQIQITLPQNG